MTVVGFEGGTEIEIQGIVLTDKQIDISNLKTESHLNLYAQGEVVCLINKWPASAFKYRSLRTVWPQLEYCSQSVVIK